MARCWWSLAVCFGVACGDDSGAGASGGAGGEGTGATGAGAAGAGSAAGAGGAGGGGGELAGGNGGGPVGGAGAGSSLRFFGNGVGDIDRVKIRIDEVGSDLPGPAIDVGATDFTIELFLKGSAAENDAGPIACNGYDWINGNIVLDRDRFAQGRAFGLSIAGGVLAFGMQNQGGESVTICGSTSVVDDAWHHVAIARRRSDGRLYLFVDGELDAEADGPDGDVSYPDDGVPGSFCGGPCNNSDPFLVLAAEKHDAGSAYPSFSGLLDELRVSTTLRYAGSFGVPTAAFVPDGDTVGLYHFDEGGGAVLGDASTIDPVAGEIKIGGDPLGPVWSSDAPF